jgi:hypothetical protein
MFHDSRIAGWWVWGINAWIGRGWCSGTGPWTYDENGGVSKRPHLDSAGQGVWRQRPHLGSGQGINRQLPHLGDVGRSEYSNLEYRSESLVTYMKQLAARLRDVRVCTGDWSRVVTKGAISHGSSVGVFLDPPYLGEVRKSNLYATDDHNIAHEVREWCLENGDNPRYRIVLAGYLTEHDHLIPNTWERIYWNANVAYQTSKSSGGNKENRKKEVLWCSPHTLINKQNKEEANKSLF